MSSEAANRFEDGFRKLDGINAASMDYRQLAALVNSMKKPVAVAKKNVINKLSRRIKILKGKKKGENEDDLNSKSEKLIDEIAIVKAMDMSRIAKFALANEDTVDNLSRKGRVTPHLLCLTRLAEDKSLKVFVQKWRADHSDWKILANFILSKNTSRHFKRSEQKRKITKDSLLVEKELIHKRLETQIGGLPAADVNQPLVERTSKGKKYKKKGREVREDPREVEITEAAANQQDPSGETEYSDDGARGDNPDEDDLYTFNIVDDDLDQLEQEGQEVVVSQEDKSNPVDSKTQLIAQKLFVATSESNPNTETDSKAVPSGDNKTVESRIHEEPGKQGTSLSTSKTKLTDKPSEITASVPKQKITLAPKRSINNRKPKAKKAVNQQATDSEVSGEVTQVSEEKRAPITRTKKQPKMAAVVQQVDTEEPTEMVKTVLNIEELANQNVETISAADGSITTVKPVTRRKKSAFFLGGEDEIDESLGTSKEEQDRARKNQKVTGYKGMRDSEKKWLSSTFTESLKTNVKPSRKKIQKSGKDSTNEERAQRPTHQSQKFANKQQSTKTGYNKQASDKKGGPKTFNAKPQSKAKPDPPIESLHPSWQASKRRKEQLELVKNGPQGKKIKFDDD